MPRLLKNPHSSSQAFWNRRRPDAAHHEKADDSGQAGSG